MPACCDERQHGERQGVLFSQNFIYGVKIMKICEIFASIQGESSLQGCPAVFVRLTGCNLDCRYCDTRYAREGGTDLSIDEIIKKVLEFGLRFVCITGGEPLLQKDTPAFAQECINRGYTVSVETNGTFDASVMPEKVKRIIDIKCPGSGEHDKTHPANISQRRPSDEFKFVLKDRADFDYACNSVRTYQLAVKNTILFSPAWNILEPSVLAEWIVKEMPEARLQLQLHKYIWPKGEMGERMRDSPR